jgi:hypothetical protein
VGRSPRLPSNGRYATWAGDRHLIVKEYLKAEEYAAAPVHEHRALELLAPLDVAPRPVGIDPEHTTERRPIVVYEYRDGEMWDLRRPSAEELAALGRQTAADGARDGPGGAARQVGGREREVIVGVGCRVAGFRTCCAARGASTRAPASAAHLKCSRFMQNGPCERWERDCYTVRAPCVRGDGVTIILTVIAHDTGARAL